MKEGRRKGGREVGVSLHLVVLHDQHSAIVAYPDDPGTVWSDQSCLFLPHQLVLHLTHRNNHTAECEI